MRTAITRSPRSVVLLVMLPLLLRSAARADTNPAKLPAVAAAMQKAQNVYLVPNDYDPEAKQITSSKDFLIFYNGVQALGRYQFVPTAGQADLILRYDAHGNARTIVLLDPTLHEIGEFWSGGIRVGMSDASLAKAANGDLQQAVKLIGSSTAKTPPVPLAPPVARPNPAHGGIVVTDWHSSQAVYIADLGVYKGFPPSKLPYQPGQLKTLFAAQLASLGHYKVVDSVAQADVVVELQGIKVEETQSSFGPHGTKDTTVIVAVLHLGVYQAKTLDLVYYFEAYPQTKIKKGKPDPREATVQILFKSFVAAVKFPSL